ncbi:MAG: RHS repeat-associated core domain-containing protein [Chitinophagaceae bacterium]
MTISDARTAVDDGTYQVLTACPTCLPGFACLPCYDVYIKQNSTPDDVVDYYLPQVLTANDYYPFGMLMPGRKFAEDDLYRYGFNGKENDNDVKGEGNQQDYGMRIYDPRLGRFLSVDPLTEDYPWYTPYQFAGNDVLRNIDLDGAEPSPTGKEYEGETKVTTEQKIQGVESRIVTFSQTWVYHEGGVNGSKAGYMKQEDYFEDVLKPMAKKYSESYKEAWEFATSRKLYKEVAGSGGNSYEIASMYEKIVGQTATFIKENPTVEGLERWIPIWGSWKQAYLDFSVGKWKSGVFNTVLGASDFFLVKSIVGAPAKAVLEKGLSGGLKRYFGVGMSHEYGASVARWRGLGLNVSGYKHHWLISQELMEKYPLLKSIGNQQWNLTRFNSQANHMRWGHFQTYGGVRYPFARYLYPITSTPTWFKTFNFSVGGRFLSQP